MSDTDIKALVERLREVQMKVDKGETVFWRDVMSVHGEAAAALEARQAALDSAHHQIAVLRPAFKEANARAEKAEAETERLVEQAIANDAADRLITVDEIRRAALEEAAEVADPYGWCGYGKEICGPKIAAAIRALAGDKS